MKSMHGFLAVIILLMAPAFHVEAEHQFALKNGNQVVGDIQANTLKLKTGVGVVDVPVREITSILGSSITLYPHPRGHPHPRGPPKGSGLAKGSTQGVRSS